MCFVTRYNQFSSPLSHSVFNSFVFPCLFIFIQESDHRAVHKEGEDPQALDVRPQQGRPRPDMDYAEVGRSTFTGEQA